MHNIKKVINKNSSVSPICSAVYKDDIFVTYQFLANFFMVSVATVKKWVSKNGLEKQEDISVTNVPLFNLRETISWHKKTIATHHNSKTIDSDEEEDDDLSYLEGIEELSELDRKAFLKSTKDSLDRLKAMIDIRLNRIKIDKENGKLVDKDDVAMAIAEYTGMYVAQMKLDLRILPIELANMTTEEISDFLEPHVRSTLEILTEVFEGKTEEEPIITEALSSLGELINRVGLKKAVSIMDKGK